MIEMRRSTTAVLLALLVLALAAGCSRRGTRTGGGGPVQQPGQIVPETGSVPKAEEVLPEYVPQKKWDYATMPSPEPSGKPAAKINDVSFDAGSTTLNRQGAAVCGVVAGWMKEDAQRRVLIIGHACRLEATGDGAVALARRRAEAARDHLVKGFGIAPDRLEIASFGSQYSTADESQPSLQAIERRVEFWSTD